jgi:hypothetical protein
MPTLKPRITTTLTANTFEVIARMAKLQGVSRGSVVAELLESVGPVLARTVALLEAASDAPKQVRDGLRATVENTHDELFVVGGDVIRQMDWLLGAFEGSSQVLNPHVVTRGSGSVETGSLPPGKTLSSPSKSRSSGKNTKASGKGASDAGKKRKI